MTIAAECKCGNTGGYCNGGEGCFFNPVSEISKEIREFSSQSLQQRIADLESQIQDLEPKFTDLEMECKRLKAELKRKDEALTKIKDCKLMTADYRAVNYLKETAEQALKP